MINVERAKELFLYAISDYKSFLQSPAGKRLLKRHPLKGKELAKYLRSKFKEQ